MVKSPIPPNYYPVYNFWQHCHRHNWKTAEMDDDMAEKITVCYYTFALLTVYFPV